MIAALCQLEIAPPFLPSTGSLLDGFTWCLSLLSPNSIMPPMPFQFWTATSSLVRVATMFVDECVGCFSRLRSHKNSCLVSSSPKCCAQSKYSWAENIITSWLGTDQRPTWFSESWTAHQQGANTRDHVRLLYLYIEAMSFLSAFLGLYSLQ